MGLFSNMFTKVGPGVPKDQPPKKGAARFFEIFFRDGGMLWRANFITMLCFIPCFAALIIGEAFSDYIGMVLICALVFVAGCCLAGPALAALFGIVIKTVRNIPGYMWHDYKKYFAENAKQAIPAAIISMGLLVLDFIMLGFYVKQDGSSRLVMIALVVFGMIVITGCMIYAFAQILFIALPLMPIAKNSFMLMFGYAKRSLPAALIGVFSIAVFFGVLTWPFALVLAVIVGVPVYILVIICMWIWPVMDKTFKITELQKAKEERENATPIFSPAPPAEGNSGEIAEKVSDSSPTAAPSNKDHIEQTADNSKANTSADEKVSDAAAPPAPSTPAEGDKDHIESATDSSKADSAANGSEAEKAASDNTSADDTEKDIQK